MGQAQAVEGEGTGALGGAAVGGLGEDARDPAADRVEGVRRLRHLVAEVLDKGAGAVVEDGDQQLLLAAKVAVERLVGEARLLHDLADPGVDALGAPHHGVV